MAVGSGLAALSLSLVQWFQVQAGGAGHVAIDGAIVQDGFSAIVGVLVSAPGGGRAWWSTAGWRGKRRWAPSSTS